MYCYNCGKEIAETVKFCPYCGAEQKRPQQQKPQTQPAQQQPVQQPTQWQAPQQQVPQQPPQWQAPPAANNSGKSSSWQSRLPVILAAVALVIVVLLAVRTFHNRTDAQNELKAAPTTEPATTAAPTETEPPVPTETEGLTDGWNTIDGKRCYIQDGEKYVDLQEIDNALYYFHEDGSLAVNEDVDYDYGSILHAGRDGIIEGITYDEIWGNWSDERYSFGGGGHSSVIEFSSEIEDCDSFQFCLEAGGLHGAKVNGTWKVYIRCNGSWEFAQDINYTEPDGCFDIKLDGYKSFDAITAYPTVRGNATYSSFFYLQNVHCKL